MFKMLKIKNKRDFTQAVAAHLVEYGTGIVVHAAVKQFVPTPKIWQKIGLAAACFAVGGVISKHAVDYTDDKIEEWFDAFEELKVQMRDIGSTTYVE